MFGRGAISWASRAQRISATATSKSEYVALAEIVNELRFLRQVEAFMVPPIDYNIHVHEDNEGAIKMAENRFSSQRTRCEFRVSLLVKSLHMRIYSEMFIGVQELDSRFIRRGFSRFILPCDLFVDPHF